MPDLREPPKGARRSRTKKQLTHTVPASMSALEDLDLIEPLLKRLRQRPARASGVPDAAAPAEPPELPVVSGQHLGRLLGQEVVRLMLEHLTHDERLLPAIRQQIGLLEPALISLSQAEPRFFSDRMHPARQLLEALTQRSLGFQSHADEGFAELLQSVSAAVRSINRVQVSEEIFARLLRRLRQRWEQDDARKLQRRADEVLTASLDHRMGAWNWGASVQLVSDRFDNAANTVRLPGFGTVDLHARYAVNQDWSLALRWPVAASDR